MKNISILFVICIFMLAPFFSNGQNELALCKLATVARFTEKGSELRWIPDNKTILKLGFANSYTIERADSSIGNFQVLATVSSFSKEKWDSLIANESDIESQSNLELAGDFLFAESNDQQNKISLDKGIAELSEQKSKEDMVYAVFVFTTIKDGKVAEALGLGYFDATAEEGKTYIYRVKLNAFSPVYKVIDGEVTVKAKLDPNKYKNEVFVYPGDQKLSFAWPSKAELAGYYVERAAEGESKFKPLNSVPFYASSGSGYDGPTNGAFMDDSLTNYKWYTYRFYGTTAFGERILFAEVKGMPRDLTPPDNPILPQPKHVKPKEVLVTWEQYGNISDLRGFIVARSDRDTGNFQILHKKLLPAKARTYTDTSFKSGGINYYVVYAIDTSGNLSSSYPAYVALIDSTPPAKPQILSAIIDTLGVVTITIKKGAEKDLKGYKLFMANSTEHEFSVIEEAYKADIDDTTAFKLVLTDTVTLQSLTPKILYRIKALDFNYNQSEFSEIVAVVRPDTIPPVTPVFSNVIVREKEIELHFVLSESIDVKQHILYRKSDLMDQWVPFLYMDSINVVVDTNVQTGTTYYYSLRAVDESNLYSGYAQAVYGKPYDTGVRPSVKDFSGSIEEDKAILTWSYPQIKDKDIYFVIYKENEKGDLVNYVSTTQYSITDSILTNLNSYAIKACTTDGGKSDMSEVIQIVKK